ncbi:MAG: septation protein IspZ, partial [Alphaproteobacteria bacterium]|nr:septation protein IspZ [Alphaproteobacteria bacterium]
LALQKVWLKHLFGGSMVMNDQAWRILTKRFIGFFLFSAVLNEIIWRTQSDDFWVNFKVFGIMGLTFAFIATQMPFLHKNMEETESDKKDDTVDGA